MNELIDRIIASRQVLDSRPCPPYHSDNMAEGGCGVLGVSCSVPIKGKYLLQPMTRMHNRGNGKGGGIAAVGLSASQLGVSQKILEETYIIQIAYLDPEVREEVEAELIRSRLDVERSGKINTIEDYKEIGLEMKPPDVWRYFVKVKEDRLADFVKKNRLENLDVNRAEDEFIYQNSFELNRRYYAPLGEKKAFVLSHGKNMIVLKIVGYAEQVLRYYKLEDLQAYLWIGHQRYPTKGRVWHPGGSHPFIGLHDALVHNGDFANYPSIVEYLKQKKTYPMFLTDTEVAALCWDLLTRVYEYPLEYAIEATAPTTERDLAMLPDEKRRIYKAIQATHIHSSPDGPWFFIIARNDPARKLLQLIGITDTSMLRPQVFALQEGEISIGLIASEKQAIDATLEALANDDNRVRPVADAYWYARGGSHTDGGAFIFTIDETGTLNCTDKFGRIISAPTPRRHDTTSAAAHAASRSENVEKLFERFEPIQLFKKIARNMKDWHPDDVCSLAETIAKYGRNGDLEKSRAINLLRLLIDRRYDIGDKRRSEILPPLEEELYNIFNSTLSITSRSTADHYCLIDYQTRSRLGSPTNPDQTLLIDVSDFAPEGQEGTCQFLDKACRLGWKKIVAYNFAGQRNFAAGLVTKDKVKIDVYGNVGDCLAAFADGPEIHVHESAQDSVGYCLKSGRLVIFGDVGKAFEYGAKGGVTFVLGDVVDRPLINAVGSATAVINGSCKDYMGESFMAANGLIVLNGIRFENGRILEQETPYQGGNLFPLAAAGAVYLRDPRRTVAEDQLNGAEILDISIEEWQRIKPLLKENEELFGITVEGLLRVGGIVRRPEEVYRKVAPVEVAALSKYDQGI